MNILADNLWALHARAAAEVATKRAASIITSLVLRRRFPVPVTFGDLRAAHRHLIYAVCPEHGPVSTVDEDGCCLSCGGDAMEHLRTRWNDAIKQATGALDEVYAVVDGREVRVATVTRPWDTIWTDEAHAFSWRTNAIDDLYKAADDQGYWERLHEVRLDISRDELRTEGVV